MSGGSSSLVVLSLLPAALVVLSSGLQSFKNPFEVPVWLSKTELEHIGYMHPVRKFAAGSVTKTALLFRVY